jgi:hypothetical protein
VVLEVLPRGLPRQVSAVDAAALVVGVHGRHGGAEVLLLLEATHGAAELLLLHASMGHGGRGRLAVLANEDLAAHEHGVVEHLDHNLRVGGARELHDAAALAPAVGERENVSAGRVEPGGLDVVLELPPRHAPGEVAHEAAAGLGDAHGGLLHLGGREAIELAWVGG